MRADKRQTAETVGDGQTSTQQGVDLPQIESLGRGVITAMQTVRELLQARAAALEACRDALDQHYQQLQSEQKAFADRETELCRQFEDREQQLSKREAGCEELMQQQETRAGELRGQQEKF